MVSTANTPNYTYPRSTNNQLACTYSNTHPSRHSNGTYDLSYGSSNYVKSTAQWGEKNKYYGFSPSSGMKVRPSYYGPALLTITEYGEYSGCSFTYHTDRETVNVQKVSDYFKSSYYYQWAVAQDQYVYTSTRLGTEVFTLQTVTIPLLKTGVAGVMLQCTVPADVLTSGALTNKYRYQCWMGNHRVKTILKKSKN